MREREALLCVLPEFFRDCHGPPLLSAKARSTESVRNRNRHACRARWRSWPAARTRQPSAKTMWPTALADIASGVPTPSGHY
jgi:hypothetical protein